jgi:hypothetical protein
MGRRPLLDKAHKLGKSIFLYPHAARPQIAWDGLYEPYPHITACFVIAEGHAEVMRRYGYPHPLEVTGWTYCYPQAFRPTPGRHVLFGPNHPNANGWLSEVDRDINRRAFEILLALHRAGAIVLTVQYLRGLDQNGLWEEPGVRYIQARPDQSVARIDEADVVVSTQTLAYLAVARGKPTIMLGENTPPRGGNCEENFAFVVSWEKYRDYMRFPFDLLNTDDPAELIERAARTDEPVRAWRDRFIGPVLKPERFTAVVDRYMEVRHAEALPV